MKEVTQTEADSGKGHWWVTMRNKVSNRKQKGTGEGTPVIGEQADVG
jgi:hypothetical protein